MVFLWPLMVLALAYAIFRFLFMLILHNVLSIEVDVSDVLEDGSQMQENSFIYVPLRERTQQVDLKVQCCELATMKYLGYFPALTLAKVSDVMCFSGLRSVGSDAVAAAVVGEGCDGRWNKLGEKELCGGD